MIDMLAEAIKLANLGFPVFPCFDVWEFDGSLRCRCGKHPCPNAGKHPAGHLVKNGLREASRDPRRIETWWTARTWNIGVVTGERAVVLDLDPRHGGNQSLAQIEAKHGAIPTTWRAFTGSGGEHIFFEPPAGAGIANSVNKIAAGLDIRGVGGYVIAPPSRHISGGEYAWNVDLHPDEVPLAPMPDWLVRMCGQNAAAGSKQDIAALVSRNVGEGGRNATITSLTGHLLRRWVDPNVTLELVMAWNNVRCSPPLGPDEVNKIVESICARELRRREARR